MEGKEPAREATVRSICFHSQGVIFLRDSNDEVHLLAGRNGAPILNRHSSTEVALAFMHEFPTCSRCVPLALRRRKAIKAAMLLIELASARKDE